MKVTDEIKARIDIVDFISRYVPLKRSGRNYQALCPFHQERTPSFIVFPDRGTWRCFGACGTGGDIFDFLMRRENLDFREALEVLAREAGVTLEAERGHQEHSRREALFAVNRAAADYFREILRHHPAAAPAREYLARRGVDEATAEAFGLGYALPTWDGLRDHLLGQGHELEILVQAGLVKHHQERDSYYDAFRARLIFPIHDHRGRVIGFAGRVLDDSVPKYLNTAETPIFHKSRVVYGLDKAYQAIRAEDAVVIVEGYMDVIAAHQHGFHNVVACMGTAVTEEQLRQLQRYTQRFILALDADTAGQQATLRALNQARQALARRTKPVVRAGGGIGLEERLAAELRIVALPEGQDPDDILRQSPDRWADLVQNAQPLVDYYIDMVARQFDLTTAGGKSQAVSEVVPLIAELGDEIERQHYIQQLSRLVHVSEEVIARQVQARARALRLDRRKRPGPGPVPEAGRPPEALPEGHFPDTRLQSASLLAPAILQERFLLAHLLREPHLLIWLAEAAETYELRPLGPDDLQTIEYKEILRALRRFLAGDEPWDLESFQETLSPQLHSTLADLVLYGTQLPDSSPAEMQEAALKTLLRIRSARLREDMNALQFMLQEAQEAGNMEVLQGVSAAINTIRRHRHHLDRVFSRVSRSLSPTRSGGTWTGSH